MDERTIHTPVFGRGVGGEDLRDPTERALPSQEPVRLSSDRISLLVRSEGEQAPEPERVRLRRLAIPLVELAPTRASHVREQAVEDLPTAFVEVQAFVQELAQEATTLRPSVSVGEVERTVERLLIAQPRDTVSGRQQPGPDDRADARGIGHLVPLARLKAAL